MGLYQNMNKRLLLWLVPGLLYVLFVTWYTDFGGPLSETEIAGFKQRLRENGMNPDQLERIESFMRSDSGRQFLMVNNIDVNENPPDVEGATPGESAEQLMGRYMEHMYPQLFKRASHPAVIGDAVHTAMDLVGIEGAEEWTMGALFRYRSRRTFMEIVSHPQMFGRHEFKTAALDKTIAYPIETRLYLGDVRLILGLILLSITALLDIALFGRRQTVLPRP